MTQLVCQEGSYRTRCLVCRDAPTRWFVDTSQGSEYFCQRHEANKDMRLASAPNDGVEMDLALGLTFGSVRRWAS